MKIRFGIRTLLVALTLIAAFFPFRNYFNRSLRASYPGFHLHRTLARVTNGDSFEYVSSLYDKSVVAPEPKPNFTLGAGRKPDDEYFFCYVDNFYIWYQFRNGRVVNADGSLPYSRIRQIFDESTPNLFFRFGAVPPYIAILLFGATAWIATSAISRKIRQRWITMR